MPWATWSQASRGREVPGVEPNRTMKAAIGRSVRWVSGCLSELPRLSGKPRKRHFRRVYHESYYPSRSEHAAGRIKARHFKNNDAAGELLGLISPLCWTKGSGIPWWLRHASGGQRTGSLASDHFICLSSPSGQ